MPYASYLHSKKTLTESGAAGRRSGLLPLLVLHFLRVKAQAGLQRCHNSCLSRHASRDSCLQCLTSEPGVAPALPGLRQNSMRCAKPRSPEAAPISSTCLKAARPSSDFTPQEAAAALQTCSSGCLRSGLLP